MHFESNERPLIYIVILNWNGWRDTINCLKYIQLITYPNFRTIVIDNGSEDNSWESIKDWAIKEFEPTYYEIHHCLTNQLSYETLDNNNFAFTKNLQKNVVFLRSRKNLGFSGGCNIGISYAIDAGADYVFLLNNDAETKSDILDFLTSIAYEAKASVVGARVQDKHGKNDLFVGNSWPHQLFGFKKLPPQKTLGSFWPSSYASGCAMLISRDILKRRYYDYGYFFDPKLFMYCEDNDFCLYALSQNYKCVIAREAIVYHEPASSSGGAGNPRSYYYLTRNRIFLCNFWLNTPEKILFHMYYIPSRLTIMLLSLCRRRLNIVKAVANAIIDGYRGVTGKWKNH